MNQKSVIISIFMLVLILIFCVGFNYSNKLKFFSKNHDIFLHEQLHNFPSRLYVKKNQLVDSQGKEVILRGVMAPDPERLKQRKLFKREYYQGISQKGANVIRVPVHPEFWIENHDYLFNYLEPIVAWAGELGMYVVIDWHYIGNITTGAGEKMVMLEDSPEELTLRFWKETATYFRNTPNVIFEIYNEPTDISDSVWRRAALKIVKEIRATSAQQIILVSGINYALDLNWVKEAPIKEENIAYTAHIFPDRNRNQISLWEWSFGEVAEKYPVIISEWGFIDPREKKTKQTYLIGNQELFGKPFLKYLSERKIGWIAAWYDDEWEAPMFYKKYKKSTNYGKLVFDGLLLNQDKRDK